MGIPTTRGARGRGLGRRAALDDDAGVVNVNGGIVGIGDECDGVVEPVLGAGVTVLDVAVVAALLQVSSSSQPSKATILQLLSPTYSDVLPTVLLILLNCSDSNNAELGARFIDAASLSMPSLRPWASSFSACAVSS